MKRLHEQLVTENQRRETENRDEKGAGSLFLEVGVSPVGASAEAKTNDDMDDMLDEGWYSVRVVRAVCTPQYNQ